MNKILIILSLVLLASCGSSQKDKNIAAVTCSIMSETRNMDAAVRVREMNDAREKIGGEPFLGGDSAIQEAFEWGLCQELVLNVTYDETLQPLKDAKRERERIAAEKQRLVDSKPSVKEYFYPNGKLKKRKNLHPRNDGAKPHGLVEEYHENGQLKSKGNFKDGDEDGLWETYHENGQLKSKRYYKDGEKIGLMEEYFDNGQLDTRWNFQDGYTHGLYERFKENGEVWHTGCWQYDELVDALDCEK